MIRHRVRLRFSKHSDLRLLGHRDLLRTLERLFRRAGLALSMSEGFHPKPRMSFPSALAVGVAGTEEVMELELAEERSAEDVLAAIRPQCPAGLEFASAEVLPPGAKKACVTRATYALPIPPDRRQQLQPRMVWLLEQSTHLVQRPGRAEPIDIRRLIDDLILVDGTLQMKLRIEPEAGIRPRELLAALGIEDLETQGFYLTRTGVELHP